MIARAPIIFRHHDGAPGRQGNAINVANPHERGFGTSRYLFQFGSIGSTYVLAYGYCLEDALEEAAEFLAAEKLWGHITPHDWGLDELGCDCADPFECEAHTYTESGWLDSCEWTAIEAPSNDYLRIVHGTGFPDHRVVMQNVQRSRW